MNCARSIVELITRYWSYSIDALKPERAIVDGHWPMFFSGQGNVRLKPRSGYQKLSVANRLILRSHYLEEIRGKSSNSGQTNVLYHVCHILFCADPSHSGILVRNDAAKDKLRQRLRNSIIMSGLMLFH